MSTSQRELGQVILNLQVLHIRSTLAKEIKELDACFRKLLQQISIFLLVTEKHFHSTSVIIVNADTVTSLCVRFIGYSNNILGFLDFLAQKTGLSSGGDAHLQKQVQAMTSFVKRFLGVLIAHIRAADSPGRELGLIYNKHVSIVDGSVVHRNGDVDDDEEIIDFSNPNMDPFILLHNFHLEPIGYPLAHVPGTQWHKFFGNISPIRRFQPAELFKAREYENGFVICIPSTLEWIEDDICEQYRSFDEVFDVVGHGPLQPLQPAVQEQRVERIQQRLMNYFEGAYRSIHQVFHYDENTSEISCPQYDLLGRVRFEALNLEINTPELDGAALLGGDAHGTVDYLESDQLFFDFHPPVIDDDDDDDDIDDIDDEWI
ncbi:hypothetical protein QBC44DRAFT_365126 [Cladorrhinum sp. PSN332]|nr:hypothetical protein QBC44DRAFT_365126 [Cladorrhinum sp. PSN332]